jgi:hypothetical protein
LTSNIREAPFHSFMTAFQSFGNLPAYLLSARCGKNWGWALKVDGLT